MAPILHCVRHAQDFHNLGAQFHRLPDPRLTPVGEEQCLALKEKHFPDQSQISLVAASPLTRTIHTAAIAFEPALKSGGTIFTIPDAQETSDYPCDTGSDIPVLKKTCEDSKWPVDLSLLQDGWNLKTIESRYAPDSHAIRARAKDARKLLREKMKELVASGDKDAEIVLVTHGGYLHYFTNDWEAPTKLLGTGWQNCETRSYVFEDGVDAEDNDAYLVETIESRGKRGLDYPMFSREKQEELFQQGMELWEGQGLQNASTMPRSSSGEITEKKTGHEPASVPVEAESNQVKVAA